MQDDAGADPLVIADGRQSHTAAGVQRGVCRLLRARGLAPVCEFTLASGRRADIIAIGGGGEVWIVEIKSSPADYLSDSKWPEYRDFCDRLFFAIPLELDAGLIDESAGLIVADAWGAEIMRHAPEHKIAAARRKALILAVARNTALRLNSLADPNADVPGHVR